MKKVILYGVGVNCDAFMRYSRNRDFEIAAYVDKNKAGENYRGFIIKDPNEIRNMIFDELFLTVGENTVPIKSYLINEIGIDEKKIKDAYYLNRQYMLWGMEKYKYVFINARSKQYKILYSDLKKNDEVFMSCLLVCEGSWKLDTHEEMNTNPKVILFNFEYGLSCECIQFFKDKFPAAKIVLTFNDMISGENGYENVFQNFSLNRLKEISDLIITYHPYEAKKYGLSYYPQVFSKIVLPKEEETYDVFFTGMAKNRLEIIHAVYKKLTDNGIKCKFWISGVAETQMLESHEGIIYNQNLTYEEYLDKVNDCRCILDIIQVGDIHSTRYTEAVTYNKKYLTNDLATEQDHFYNKQYMQVFDTVEHLDVNWLKAQIAVDYRYKNEFSPIHLIEFICKKLCLL